MEGLNKAACLIGLPCPTVVLSTGCRPTGEGKSVKEAGTASW